MAERTIVGVDFSGRKSGNTTWVTKAALQGNTLDVDLCCRPAGNRGKAYEKLENLLHELRDDAVGALDFPFSLPRDFAIEVAPNASRMPDVWEAVANIKEYSRFDKLRRYFVERHGEMIRRGDANFGGPFSPLKAVNPDMLPMTFHGMRMLHRLWTSDKGFRVPPLCADKRCGPTLLETMPGVLLRRFGLPATNYKSKNKSNKGRPEDVRETILDGLEKLSAPTLKIPDNEKERCLTNADCLDSLVAAIGAALWVIDKSQFLIPRGTIPTNEEIALARLEGWIYAPSKPLNSV